MGHWYLVAYDTRAEDWRIYRLDRTAGPAPTGHRVPARTLPAPDPAAFVAAKVATAPARHRAVATVHAPAVAVLARTQGLPGRVTPIDDATCTVDLSGGSLARIAQLVAALDADYTPDADPEVVGYLRAAAQRTLHRTQPVGDSWPEPR
ncbi:WYL domain-containing protein [Streptomyces nojiriensis]|uniref:WYL domain-containing protein n=1 Tax=Streptomyces nojiriensis TaxID=66374 RepID=UPI00368DCAA0